MSFRGDRCEISVRSEQMLVDCGEDMRMGCRESFIEGVFKLSPDVSYEVIEGYLMVGVKILLFIN